MTRAAPGVAVARLRSNTAGRLAVALALLCAGCGELSSPAVVRLGDEVLTVDDLRRAYAERPTPVRPLLSDPADRLDFVDLVIRRRLLAEHGASVAAADTALLAELRARREEMLVERLRVVATAGIEIAAAAESAAVARMQISHRLESLHFASGATAEAVVAEMRSGEASWAEVAGRDHVSGNVTEWVRWSPFSNPVLDVAETLALRAVSDPIPVAGSIAVIRVTERKEHPPGEEEVRSTLVLQGLRARERAERVGALVRETRERAKVQWDDAAILDLVARTEPAILASDFTELDREWAIPDAGADGDRVLATWHGGSWTFRNYCDALRRVGPTQRPRNGPLDADVRGALEGQLEDRLLLGEAIERGLEDDWWVGQGVALVEEDAWVSAALEDIQARIVVSPERVDTLATAIASAQPDAFERTARARFLRFDFSTPEGASAELSEILRAGGGMERLKEILSGAPTRMLAYHVMALSPGGVGVPSIETALFDEAAPRITGPHALASAWVVIERLALERSRWMGDEAIHEELADRVRRSETPAAVTRWLEARKRELGVSIDEEALAQISPGR